MLVKMPPNIGEDQRVVPIDLHHYVLGRMGVAVKNELFVLIAHESHQLLSHSNFKASTLCCAVTELLEAIPESFCINSDSDRDSLGSARTPGRH